MEAPSTPASGSVKYYIDSDTNTLKCLHASGEVSTVTPEQAVVMLFQMLTRFANQGRDVLYVSMKI